MELCFNSCYIASKFDSEAFVTTKQKMLKSILACCKIYISESRNKSALHSIEQAAKLFPQAPIINKFEDDTYNRIGYTLVSKLEGSNLPFYPLKNAVFQMVKVAFESIDLELHQGTHPRLGVVDHICFHPLGSTSLDQVSVTAKSLADDIGSNLQAPSFLYGAANEEKKSLDSIRRELGYFKPNLSGTQWAGGSTPGSIKVNPDAGPNQVSGSKGVVLIGATKWVDNYNIPLYTTNISTSRRIAKRVSGRGGGLHSVQSMALAHDDVIEVACNLLEPSRVNGEQVQAEVERLGEEEGVQVGKGYYTDFSQDRIIDSYNKLGEFN